MPNEEVPVVAAAVVTDPPADPAPAAADPAPKASPADAVLAAIQPAVSDEPAAADPPAVDPKAAVAAPATPPPADPAAVAKAEADAAAAKVKEAFSDLPADVKGKTRERFEQMRTIHGELVEKHKAVETERDAIRAEYEDFTRAIQSTGTSPDQYKEALTYLADVNSGTREGLERAYAKMSGELAALGKTLGKQAPGFDPIAAHPDLAKRVEDGDLTQQDALEIVQARSGARLDTVITERRTADTQATAAAQEAAKTALQDLGKWGNEQRAANPARYNAALPMLQAIAEAATKNGTPPSGWKAVVETAYAKFVMPAAAAPALPPAPIRPGPAAGGGDGAMTPKPKSALEAIQAAFV